MSPESLTIQRLSPTCCIRWINGKIENSSPIFTIKIKFLDFFWAKFETIILISFFFLFFFVGEVFPRLPLPHYNWGDFFPLIHQIHRIQFKAHAQICLKIVYNFIYEIMYFSGYIRHIKQNDFRRYTGIWGTQTVDVKKKVWKMSQLR